MDQSRRNFITNGGKAAIVGSSGIFALNNTQTMTAKNMFVHHVYFWLKNPESKEDRQKLIEGLIKLSKVSAIKVFHIGEPANTNRDVIDRSYAVSWLCLFDSAKDQDSYQVDPIHLKFVDECSHLWEKVIVYDSVDAK